MTGELGNKIDSLWEIFWNGGITNPLDVVEQMTYLMFIKDLDDTDNLRAKEAAMLGLSYKSIFADEVEIGNRKVDGNQLKWSTFHDFPAQRMYSVVQEWVFPFIKNLHGDKNSAYSKYIPVLRIGNINAGFFRPVNLVYWEDDDALNRYKMYPGDLVMSLTGTVGKDDYGNVCILGNDYDVYYLNQRNAKLELQDSINKYYLSMLLKFESVKKKLTGISRGVRQANISNKDILNLSVPIPPIELQNRFAEFVNQVDKLKVAVQKALEETQMLFDSLMQDYFGYSNGVRK